MDKLEKTKNQFMNQVASIGKQWGLGESVGRVWGLLLFEDEPLSQKEIAKECKYSLSLVSPSIKFLEKMGLVGIVGKREREKLYVATLSFLEAFEKILSNFLQLNIEPIIDLLSEAEKTGDKKTAKRLKKITNEYKKTLIFSNFLLSLIKTKKVLDVRQLSKLLERGENHAGSKMLLNKMPVV